MTFVHRRVVAFHETDAAGIVHFATYLRWFEDAEHAWLRALGASVHEDRPDGGFRGFPRVHVEADYKAPLRFEDPVEVHADVRTLGRSKVVYAFAVHREGETAPRVTGTTTVVCAEREGADGALRAAPLPAAIREGLAAHLDEAQRTSP